MISDSHQAQMSDLGQRFRAAASQFDWLSHEQRTLNQGRVVTLVHFMLSGTSPDGYRVRVRVRHRVEWRGRGTVRSGKGVPPAARRVYCAIQWPRRWKANFPEDIADAKFTRHWSRRGIRTKRYAIPDYLKVDLALLVDDLLAAARTVAPPQEPR